jgi:hypothetical protein
VLFVHDVHAVMGERELEFEDSVRTEYAPAVAADDDTRLLWYLNSTHGAGEAYKVVTITAIRDGAAWERHVERLRRGALSAWSGRADAMRYGLVSTLLVGSASSPLAELDLASVATEPQEHPLAVYREDTLAGAGLDAVLDAADPSLGDTDDAVLTPVGTFRPAVDPSPRRVVLYRVAEPDRWTPVFGLDAGWDDWPGSLTPTLPPAVSGSSRMLRTSSWSPLP